MTHPLLDLPPLTAERFASIERGVARLLGTRQDVVITQGEALLPLEGCIRSGARPGSVALNVVTGPYGTTFGNWLRDAGADVVDLAVPFDTAVSGEQVARALAERPEIDFVSLVHAEAATGNTNPVAEIGEAVRAHGALFMLDAVASVGAEPLLPDEWGVDLCVIGAQKAMGGPAGVSAVSVSERAWARFAENPAAPRRSYLSLLDWKERWIDGGRKTLLHAPAQLEMLALEACLDRIGEEGLAEVLERHAAAARATRAGAAALGIAPWVADAAEAAPVATTLRVADASLVVAKALSARPSAPLAAGGGALAREMVRVNHYGPAASPEAVEDALRALAAALTADPEPAVAAASASAAWS
ncbi:aminotransferase class V-fold PLP-dependent enzyme [Streptomyces sp. NBC_00249]|uniref:pyridoxal-phosphate-dependent aminotransferase family protein n=1 Tax=Streptomyces sp. NBC_00249 TaxID=2975690 RepID=UPI00225A458C|nr:aminotransferase class V-fold PLP-dependent enzyme [Streptomyces sp. NBC_00249]MCX5196547.1 aminotransferase class V-fold PLP-dependent enzyme [Streptomyces sp. NBC_00249]